MKYFIPIILIFIATDCTNNTKNTKDTIPKSIVTNPLQDSNSLDWCDSLIMRYIQHSNNPIIKAIRSDTATPIQWMFDSREVTDTANYLIFHLGHDVMDSGVAIMFATDGWLYIDSLKRRLYQYDVAADTLKPIE